MNHFDGWILNLIGILLLFKIFRNKSVYILGGVAGLSITALLSVYMQHTIYLGLHRTYSETALDKLLTKSRTNKQIHLQFKFPLGREFFLNM